MIYAIKKLKNVSNVLKQLETCLASYAKNMQTNTIRCMVFLEHCYFGH